MTVIRYLFLIGMILGAFSLYAQEEKEVSSTRIDKLPYYLKTDTLTGEKKRNTYQEFFRPMGDKKFTISKKSCRRNDSRKSNCNIQDR